MNLVNRSALRTRNGLPHFEIRDTTERGWVQNVFLTRRGGVSHPPYDSLNVGGENGDAEEHVAENKDRILTAFALEPRRLVLLQQSHFDQILLLRKPVKALPSPLPYDGMVTDDPHLLLGILTADCVPIFIADPRKKAIGAVHAGRHGTGLQITSKVIQKMSEAFGSSPEDLLVVLGPSIGFCCYEIDEKVFKAEWEPFAMPVGEGKWMIDLARINISLLEQAGVRTEHISWIDLCTRCNEDLFFSYRREGETGRQLSFIGII